MKGLSSVALFVLVTMSSAQSNVLGTKADIVKHVPTSSAVGVWDVVQMIVALAIVFALLKWALPKVVAKMNRRMGGSSSETIKLEESAMLGGCQLQIVTVRGRTLLLGASQAGVNYLADLSERTAERDEPAFFELVDQATEADVTVDFVSESDRIAHERLSRLSI